LTNQSPAKVESQYSLAKILGIWAAAAVPMPFLSFVIGPALAPVVDLKVEIVRWMMIIVGLAWLFVLSMIMLRRELGTLRWSVIGKRMWYQTPRDPKTGEPKAKLLWWALPAVLLNGIVVFTPVGHTLQEAILTVFPSLRPWVMQGSDLLSPEFVGQWWLLGVMIVSMLFNYFLGEEFLFRGVLLPKMKGVFGRWDWIVNVVLFSFWHWHQPWGFISTIASFLIAGWASRRYQSNWIFFIAHGADGVFMFVMLLLVVAGLSS
jgi:membrane protease YdiL (CAAX protease family)